MSIQSSDLVSNAGGGISLNLVGGSAIRNTLVISNTGSGVQSLASGGLVALQNTDVWGNITDYNSDFGPQTGVNGNISLDPLFISFAAGNYHLSTGSPAIDTGTPTGAPTMDVDGESRPRDAGYDMGFAQWTGHAGGPPLLEGFGPWRAAAVGPY